MNSLQTMVLCALVEMLAWLVKKLLQALVKLLDHSRPFWYEAFHGASQGSAILLHDISLMRSSPVNVVTKDTFQILITFAETHEECTTDRIYVRIFNGKASTVFCIHSFSVDHKNTFTVIYKSTLKFCTRKLAKSEGYHPKKSASCLCCALTTISTIFHFDDHKGHNVTFNEFVQPYYAALNRQKYFDYPSMYFKINRNASPIWTKGHKLVQIYIYPISAKKQFTIWTKRFAMHSDLQSLYF